MSMMKSRIEYKELSKAKVSDSRNILVSTCTKGGEQSGYTIAQQLEAQDGDKVTTVFLKGAFHVDDLHGLYNLRDAINLAIQISEEPDSDETEDWDS